MYDWGIQNSKPNIPVQGRALMLSGPPVDDMDHGSLHMGFHQLGFEVNTIRKRKEWIALSHVFYMNHDSQALKDVRSLLNSHDVVFGDVNAMRVVWQIMGKRPDDITFPKQLVPYLGRELFKMGVLEGFNYIENSGEAMFLKPFHPKQFQTRLVSPESCTRLKMEMMNHDGDMCYVSEVLPIIIEFRCFILDGEIQDVRHYTWDQDQFCLAMQLRPSLISIQQMVEDFTDQPRAYVIDVGVTAAGEVFLIECNDGQSFGSYGLEPEIYAAMHLARYREVMDK